MSCKNFLISIFSLFFLFAVNGGSLVKNGSFSKGLDGWRKCGWTKNPGRVSIVNGSLQILQENAKQRTNMVQVLKLKPAAEYRISFRMKCSKLFTGKQGGVQLYVLMNSRRTLFRGAVNGRHKNASGTFDWKKISFDFKTPAEKGRYELYIQMINAAGIALIDDISLEELPPAQSVKLDLRFYPAKFQMDSMNLVCGFPHTVIGEFFAAPRDAVDMKLEIDLPPEIRFIGSTPWWRNAEKKFLPDPVKETTVTRNGKKYKRYTVTLEKFLLSKMRRDRLLWNNSLRIFIAGRKSSGSAAGYFRLRSPRGGVSPEKSIKFTFLPPLEKFVPTQKFTLGITGLYNLSAPFEEVRKASEDLLFSLSRRPLTNATIFWSLFPEKLRRSIIDRTYFVLMFSANDFGIWRKKNKFTSFRLDTGKKSSDTICPTHAAEEFNSPYWQKYWLEKIRSRVARFHRVDCLEWDIEPMEVCRCSLCRDRFSRELKLKRTVTAAETNTRYSARYFQFRVKQNGRMIRNFGKLVRQHFPRIRVGIVTDNLHAAPPHIAYWCGVDIRQFDDVFDVMRNMPYYSGITYFDDFEFNVRTLKTPQWPLNDPTENMEMFYSRYTPASLRMNIIATAALGGQGFALYPTEFFDGAYLHCLQSSVSAVSAAEKYYRFKGKSFKAEPQNVISITSVKNGKSQTASIPDLKSTTRLLAHEIPGKGKLLTIFNYASSNELILEIPVQGKYRTVRDPETNEIYTNVDGTKPFLVSLAPNTVKLIELTNERTPRGRGISQSTIQKALDRFRVAAASMQISSRRSGAFFAGWDVGKSGSAVAGLSDGINKITLVPEQNGRIVSWSRKNRKILDSKKTPGMLDEWLVKGVNETVPWRVTGFAAGKDHASVTLEATLPPPRNAAPDALSLQGVTLRKRVTLKGGALHFDNEVVNTAKYTIAFVLRIRNFPELSLPCKLKSGKTDFTGRSGTGIAHRKGNTNVFGGKVLNSDYKGEDFLLSSRSGTLLFRFPAASGVMVWSAHDTRSTVEPWYDCQKLAPGKKFIFKSVVKRW